MPLFLKKNKDKPAKKWKKAAESAAEEGQEIASGEPQKAPIQKATLASGRLAPVFLRMYRWIVSANLGMDIYQIESGEQVFAGEPVALRGRYSELMARFREKIIEEQRPEFDAAFQPQRLANVFMDSGTGVSGVYCLTEEADTDFVWYEVRAEQIPNGQAQSLQCVLYFRRVRDGSDYGNEAQKKPKPVETESGLDWDKIRIQRILGSKDEAVFEYNVAQDCMILHLGLDDPQPRQYDRYLSGIDKVSDWRIHHESVHVVRDLIQGAMGGKEGEAIIQYRTSVNYGAPFRYYHIHCMPLEETGKPTWVFGYLRDVDGAYRKSNEMRQVTGQINGFMDQFFAEIYLIDTEKNLTWKIIRTENGYQSHEKRYNFANRIRSQIERGVIAQESAQAYLEWTEKDFLSRKTAKGNWEMEGLLKLPGSVEYRWYEETISPVRDRPGIFLQIRRDVTQAKNLRQREFVLQEERYLANYNQSMLDIMADLVEFRNIESGTHINHVRTLTKILLEDTAKRSPHYGLNARTIEMYCRAATTHDIGKITIPDSILNKPGRLTPEERAVMQTHTTNGARIIDNMKMPGEEGLKELCLDVALHHHERWDGRGYPEGLEGDAVAIGTQVIGLADAYDALVSSRCYKDAFSFDTALEMILSGQCGSFNPRLLESLKACAERMQEEYVTETGEHMNEQEETAHGK